MSYAISNKLWLYFNAELIEMTRLLKKENLTANCCEPSRIVRVENISNEGFMNKHALRRYFEKANRSGGGKIESIEEIDDRSAFHVTFEDFEGKLCIIQYSLVPRR